MTFSGWLAGLSREHRSLVLGLDPHPGILEAWGEPDSSEGLRRWCATVSELVESAEISCVKVQVAFFERHGIPGFEALHRLLGALRAQGVWVIGDAKRGDIGSTMKGYATAWLGSGSDFEVDALTVSPYLGFHALDPVLELSAATEKGLFVLAATSNPEAWATQGARLPDGRSTAALVLHQAQEWCGQHSYFGVGVVIGATVDHTSLGLRDVEAPEIPVLAPGYGAQGADLKDVNQQFGAFNRVLPTVARSVLGAGPEAFAAVWRDSVARLSTR